MNSCNFHNFSFYWLLVLLHCNFTRYKQTILIILCLVRLDLWAIWWSSLGKVPRIAEEGLNFSSVSKNVEYVFLTLLHLRSSLTLRFLCWFFRLDNISRDENGTFQSPTIVESGIFACLGIDQFFSTVALIFSSPWGSVPTHLPSPESPLYFYIILLNLIVCIYVCTCMCHNVCMSGQPEGLSYHVSSEDQTVVLRLGRSPSIEPPHKPIASWPLTSSNQCPLPKEVLRRHKWSSLHLASYEKFWK